MTDFPTIDLTTLEIPENTKNSFGHTSAQKEKMIKDHLERPGVTDGDIQDNDFWNAYKSNNSKDMLAYVKKYGDVGEVKQNKNPSSKLDNWKYTDPLSEMVGAATKKANVEKKIATMGDRKSDGAWKRFVSKNLNKQDQDTEAQKLAEDKQREVKRDKYGNTESATDRIQQQDEDRKKLESRNRNKNETTNKNRRFR